ncbi:MAG TPA: MFS transporter [Gemmataceae bacterium]|nr:MFS transporter [Gemmataceae bacterium]
MTVDESVPAGPAAPAVSGRQRWRTLVLCVLGWLFDHYDMMLFAYIASAIGRDWQWGDAFAQNKAFLLGVALFTSGIGGVVFGGLADRFGRRRVMGWTILVYSLSTGLSGLAWGLVSLAVLRAITGFGFGGEWATGQALLAEVFPRHRRGLASALLQAGQPVGGMLAILTGLWLEPYVGWRWVFLIGAAPAVLVVFLRRYVPESPLWLARPGPDRQGFVEPYRVLVRDHWRRTLQGLVLGASKLGTFWLTFVWLPDYFAELQTGAHTADLAEAQRRMQLWAQVTLLIGMVLFGPLADRLGRRPAFTFYSLLTMGGLIALTYFAPFLLENRAWFWVAMSAVGFGSGCTAGFGALLAELFPTSIRNTAMGTVYNVSRSFQVVTQWLMAVIATDAGVSSGLVLAASFAFVTATWVWTFPETRGVALRAD